MRCGARSRTRSTATLGRRGSPRRRGAKRGHPAAGTSGVSRPQPRRSRPIRRARGRLLAEAGLSRRRGAPPDPSCATPSRKPRAVVKCWSASGGPRGGRLRLEVREVTWRELNDRIEGARPAVVPARLGRRPPRSGLVPAVAVRARRLGELLRLLRQAETASACSSAAPRRRNPVERARGSTASSRRRPGQGPVRAAVPPDRHDRVAQHRPRAETRADGHRAGRAGTRVDRSRTEPTADALALSTAARSSRASRSRPRCSCFCVIGASMVVVEQSRHGRAASAASRRAASRSRRASVPSRPRRCSAYNYAALQMAAEGAVERRGVVYVAIHDKEGALAGVAGRAAGRGERCDPTPRRT